MFKNKKWLMLLIVGFPSLFWIILETSTVNSKRLPYYGPKKVVNTTDTVFYSVKTVFENTQIPNELKNYDTVTFPIIALMFIKEKYKNEVFRITGLWEYLKYNKSKIEHIPFVLITETENNVSITETEISKMANNTSNVYFSGWKKNSFDSLNKTFFIEKPYYVDYSFFVLIDKKRKIRGYYDARYVAEVKRLIGEYQHLRLKEEKEKLININEIKAQ